MTLIAAARRSLTLSLFAFAGTAAAHDPMLHEPVNLPKAKPTTCAQYSDRANYSNDLSDPDIKALRDECAAKEADAEDPAKDPASEPKKDER